MPVDAVHNLNRLFLRGLIAAALLLGSLLTLPAWAQSTPPQGPPETTSYSALADLLENDKTREQLIEQLRSLAPEPTTKPDAPPAAANTVQQAEQDPVDIPVSERLAAGLQTFTADLVNDLGKSVVIIKSLALGDGIPGSSASRWVTALKALLLAVVATLVAYFVLRMLARLVFARLNVWIMKEPKAKDAVPAPVPAAAPAQRRGLHRFTSLALGRRLLGVAAAFLVDIAASLLAALAGYLSVMAFTANVQATAFAMQFLTAFVLIEIAKAVSRGIFSTRYDQLRLLPLSPPTAIYWNHWLTLLIGLTGYGLMVVVPIAETIFTASLAQVLSLFIMLAVYIYGVRGVWKNRKAVKAALIERAEHASAAVFGTLIRVLARTWHLIALAYLTILLVVSQAAQQYALEFMARATVQSIAAIAIGMMLAAALTSLAARRIMLPEGWRRLLPLLESRLNAYSPAVLKVLRLLILVVVTLIVLDAWHAFDLVSWVESDSGQATIALLFHIGIILAIAALSWTVLASIIEHRLGANSYHRPSEREKTLLMLFRNAAAVVISTMTVLIVLSQIGIDIGPLIAGAGVAGLAIGFGAQKLVQDVITGIFIQLENGMNQNDIVELAGIFGTVEKITIRSVVIRTLDGGYHLIPFSTIDKLTNHTRDYGYHYAEYNIAHRESVDEAVAQLEQAFKDLMQDQELAAEVMEDISIPGVTALNERGFAIRVLIKTTPGNQWMIQRGFNRLVKQRFDAAGIELPYPHTVLHFGRDKSGHAAPVDIRSVDALKEIKGSTPAPGHTMRADPEPGSLA